MRARNPLTSASLPGGDNAGRWRTKDGLSRTLRAFLDQTEAPQLLQHFIRRQFAVVAALQVGGGVVGLEIAPALEGPALGRHHRHELGVEHEQAVFAALRIRLFLEAQDALAATDRA